MEYDSYARGLEAIKKLSNKGAEYWMARELMPLLRYASWDNFKSVVEKAKLAADAVGAPVSHHIHETMNMIPTGKGAKREVEDYFLSRYACYLIAMNADSSKAEVGHAMTYFAGKTRQMEVLEKHLSEPQEDKRVQLRLRTIVNNKRLAGAAKKAGVIRYGLFQNAGYEGFYGGMGVAEVKRHKGISPNEELLDRVGPLELSRRTISEPL